MMMMIILTCYPAATSDGQVRFQTAKLNRELLDQAPLNQTTLNHCLGSVLSSPPHVTTPWARHQQQLGTAMVMYILARAGHLGKGAGLTQFFYHIHFYITFHVYKSLG